MSSPAGPMLYQRLAFSPHPWLAALMLAFATSDAALAQERVPLAHLLGSTHVHGLAVDRADSARLYIATHQGLYLLHPDLTAQQVSERWDDFMGFTPHPTESGVLFSSGHPALGGNLGFQRSDDGGRTWRRLSPGINGPVDFHQMDVSKADPWVIYGMYGTLQVSRDGGHTWRAVGAPRNDAIALAASSLNADALFLATTTGLYRSTDGGQRWQPAHPNRAPASIVHTLGDGTVYAFLVGVGLFRAREPELNWERVSPQSGELAIIHLAVDPANPQRMFAFRQGNSLAASSDGGRTWRVLAGR